MSDEVSVRRDLPGKCNCGFMCYLDQINMNSFRKEVDDSPSEQEISRLPPPPTNRDVFISHAGQQKNKVAFPLRNSLHDGSLSSFLEAEDLRPSTETVKQ